MAESHAPIPDGQPKSGRFWKSKQRTRSSSQCRKGTLIHLSKTFEEKLVKKAKENDMKELERSLVEESKRTRNEKRERVEERLRFRQANEMKNSTYQVIKPEVTYLLSLILDI